MPQLRIPTAVSTALQRLPLPGTGPLLPPSSELIDWPSQLARPSRIAYFAYSIDGYDGETTNQEDIFEVSPVTGAIRRITDDRAKPTVISDRDPVWAPSGTQLAVHRGSENGPPVRVEIISRSTGEVVQPLVTGLRPRWLDAHTLLYLNTVGSDGPTPHDEVFAVERHGLGVTQITDLGPAIRVSSLSWHPSAGLAVDCLEVATNRFGIALIPAAAVGSARAPGGRPVTAAGITWLTPPDLNVADPDWSPNGDRVALSTWIADSPGRVGYWTIADASLTLVPGPAPETPTLEDVGAVFSPDGRSLAFLRGAEDGWTEIWLCRLRDGTVRQLTDEGRQRAKARLDWGYVRSSWWQLPWGPIPWWQMG